MERLQKQQGRRERTGIIQIALIGLVLAAALAGGIHLLGKTWAAWERNRTAVAAAPPTPYTPDPELVQLRQQVRERVEQRERDFKSGKLRCINGQVFKKLPNGWENVPGDGC